MSQFTLWNRFRECRGQGLSGIPRAELLEQLATLAEQLDNYFESCQTLHVDLQPQHSLLSRGRTVAYYPELAKILAELDTKNSGGVLPLYAAPELLSEGISRHSDQYALAIVYQELLTGQLPFDGKNVRQLVMQHLSAKPNLKPLPASDRDIIGRALAKKPEERYPSCTALIQALRFGRGV